MVTAAKALPRLLSSTVIARCALMSRPPAKLLIVPPPTVTASERFAVPMPTAWIFP